MPYITREDGERFIIPSYRDMLSVKKTSLLKKEIVMLSANYGEYIALQRKTTNTYEIAFSPDPGYLLGECVWNYFKRPYDMIYCEEIPNTSEAILVIVKAGTVYLDGSFPLDSIPEELVIFKTQQNNFNIYIYGEVPISQYPEDAKFSFDSTSIKSFTILDVPVFPTLPVVKAFQLQLVDVVLKAQGIGILPVKQVVIGVSIVVLCYMAYSYISTHKKEIPTPTFVEAVSNPYQGYIDTLSSPDPTREIHTVYNLINSVLFSIPGWMPVTIDYFPGAPGKIEEVVISNGARLHILLDWVYRNDAQIDISPTNVVVSLTVPNPKRDMPLTINPIKNVIAAVLDRMSYVVPGNNVTLSAIANKKVYQETTLSINFQDMSPLTIDLIGQFLQGLPLVLNKFSISVDPTTGQMSGTITLKALGN